MDADGCVKDASNLPGVDITIIRSEIHFPCDDSSLPVWEVFTVTVWKSSLAKTKPNVIELVADSAIGDLRSS